MHRKNGVDSHCSECSGIWFEWQNRAVEREMEKWIDYNKHLKIDLFTNFMNNIAGIFSSIPGINLIILYLSISLARTYF